MIEFVSQVCLYLDRAEVKYTLKLAHMWHGSFQVRKRCGRQAMGLEVWVLRIDCFHWYIIQD